MQEEQQVTLEVEIEDRDEMISLTEENNNSKTPPIARSDLGRGTPLRIDYLNSNEVQSKPIDIAKLDKTFNTSSNPGNDQSICINNIISDVNSNNNKNKTKKKTEYDQIQYTFSSEKMGQEQQKTI